MTQTSKPEVGVHARFPQDAHDHVERVLGELASLRVERLRVEVPYVEYGTAKGRAWYSHLLSRLAAEVEVLPCLVHSRSRYAPSAVLVPPPREAGWYADFVEQVIRDLGTSFEWLELCSTPSELRTWDVELDPEWWVFAQMLASAAHRVRQHGKRVVLGSGQPLDAPWVRLFGERNVMRSVDAVGLHGPLSSRELSSRELPGTDLSQLVSKVREVLARYESSAEIWLTAVGAATDDGDERKQLSAFVSALDAPVQRLYWYTLCDEAADSQSYSHAHSSAHAQSARETHGEAAREPDFGLSRADGAPKLIHRLWQAGGVDALCETLRWGERTRLRERQRPTLITGGAGFLGTNLAHQLLESGGSVLILDDLSRPFAERNVRWLRSVHGSAVELQIADVRDALEVERAVGRASLVFHFATRSASEEGGRSPSLDFDVNVRGTLNVLEALRKQSFAPPLVYASTSHVYGMLDDVALELSEARLLPTCPTLRYEGIGEDRPLDPHSPYVCSKAAADQYVLDYARSFGLPAVVLRLASVYGPHQLGASPEGWVGRLLSSVIENRPITIEDDGTQVRDLLHVDDLVDALLLAHEHMSELEGHAWNVGGGADNSASTLELLELLADLHGELALRFAPRRAEGPRYYVSNLRRFHAITGFVPRISIEEGLTRLYRLSKRSVWSATDAVPKAWIAS